MKRPRFKSKRCANMGPPTTAKSSHPMKLNSESVVWQPAITVMLGAMLVIQYNNKVVHPREWLDRPEFGLSDLEYALDKSQDFAKDQS